MATATADTALAGPGEVTPTEAGGHWGPGRARAVQGQVVRVDTLAGADAEAMRDAFARRGAREAVVVPWDYDAACQPTYWNRSARWVEPGLAGFYTVRARPATEWVEGRPTFDAFAADHEPYSHGVIFRAGYRGADTLRNQPSLTPAEMFSLYEALPPHAAGGDSTTLAPIRRWASEHPELAHRYPARSILSDFLRRGGG